MHPDDIKEKIKDILIENDTESAAELIKNIMLQLAEQPACIDGVGRVRSVDRTIDMICEETFG